MKITFNEPVEIPGLVLPAGTYWLVLADSPTFRDIMLVYREDYSKLYATLITISAYRQQPHSPKVQKNLRIPQVNFVVRSKCCSDSPRHVKKHDKQTRGLACPQPTASERRVCETDDSGPCQLTCKLSRWQARASSFQCIGRH